MKLSSENYRQYEEDFSKLFEKISQSLSEAEVQSIKHYVNHGELEMALEGLGLTVMKYNLNFPDREDLDEMLI